MADFGWAVNSLKLQRAIEEARVKGKEGDEATIKAIYIRLAGLVIDEDTDADEKGEAQVKVSNVRGARKTVIRKKK